MREEGDKMGRGGHQRGFEKQMGETGSARSCTGNEHGHLLFVSSFVSVQSDLSSDDPGSEAI